MIDAFRGEETIARKTFNDAIMNVHRSSNCDRKRIHDNKMYELGNLCENYDQCTFENYLQSIIALLM